MYQFFLGATLLGIAVAGDVKGRNLQDGCPEMSALIMCPMIYSPVECGENGCGYSNFCMAQASGFSEEDCGPASPATVPPTELSTIGATELMTEGATATVPPTGLTTEEGTEGGSEGCTCCGGGPEEKSLGCGTMSPNDWKSYAPSAVDERQLQEGCPAPSEGLCTDIYDPVTCGENKCEYSSACLAILAGFPPEECVKPGEITIAPTPEETMMVTDAVSADGTEMDVETVAPTDDSSESNTVDGPVEAVEKGDAGTVMPSEEVSMQDSETIAPSEGDTDGEATETAAPSDTMLEGETVADGPVEATKAEDTITVVPSEEVSIQETVAPSEEGTKVEAAETLAPSDEMTNGEVVVEGPVVAVIRDDSSTVVPSEEVSMQDSEEETVAPSDQTTEGEAAETVAPSDETSATEATETVAPSAEVTEGDDIATTAPLDGIAYDGIEGTVSPSSFATIAKETIDLDGGGEAETMAPTEGDTMTTTSTDTMIADTGTQPPSEEGTLATATAETLSPSEGETMGASEGDLPESEIEGDGTPLTTSQLCSADSPCGMCEGDCNSNSDCMGGLECFRRPGNDDRMVPGCSGVGVAGADYCYMPSPNDLRVRDQQCTEENPCPACTGDCDSDFDCEGDLFCFQTNGLEAIDVPGCVGTVDLGLDFCYRWNACNDDGDCDGENQVCGNGECVQLQACGSTVCSADEYCCNSSCEICAPLDAGCTQEFCGDVENDEEVFGRRGEDDSFFRFLRGFKLRGSN